MLSVGKRMKIVDGGYNERNGGGYKGDDVFGENGL